MNADQPCRLRSHARAGHRLSPHQTPSEGRRLRRARTERHAPSRADKNRRHTVRRDHAAALSFLDRRPQRRGGFCARWTIEDQSRMTLRSSRRGFTYTCAGDACGMHRQECHGRRREACAEQAEHRPYQMAATAGPGTARQVATQTYLELPRSAWRSEPPCHSR